jgi:GT2 family glycosyltransferase
VNVSARPIARTVTVVIPTTGGPFLAGCLESLIDGDVWPSRVIVVEQGDGDAGEVLSGLRARRLDVVHIRMPRTGISAATNRGLDRVETPYAAVTHDDCRVRHEWVARLAARLPELGEAVLTGRVEPEGDGIVLTIKTAEEPAIYRAPLVDGDVLFPPNMAFPIRLLDRVGWFDEHPSLATAGEDNEWAHRALRAGVAIVYDPSVVVGHLARHRAEELPGLYERYARGQGAFYGTWLRRGDPFIARRVARDLLRAPWLLVRGLVTRNPELVSMGRGEVAGLLPGILSGLRNSGVRGCAAGSRQAAR